jgi:tRNA1(Val) A37 N6-methylase TrmN6
MEYSQLSKELTQKLSKSVKQKNGIYFTPPSCVYDNIKLLKPYIINNSTINIIEPSCGSGEYITALHKLYPNINITGIENNQIIYESILHLENDNIQIINMDYLKYNPNNKYDIIIGNPPYFVMKKNDVDKDYYQYFEGRPNIFILFIIKSIRLIKDNGIISFVLPKNFLNCLYYDKTRRYINHNFQILHIHESKEYEYIETFQDTIILIIQKTNIIDNKLFVFEINNYTIFMNKNNNLKINNLYKNSKTLFELGFKVSVGNIVWNQCKDLLTDDQTKTRLIYSSDIVNNKLILKKYNNIEKKNFIDKKGITCPLIVINRGYGVGEYKFNYCLIDSIKEYLVENHLICIKYKKKISREKLIKMYQKILVSLEDKRTNDFIRLYFSNNAINTVEINNILPIYQDI